MSAPNTARARARAALTREITRTARQHLATVGAAGLSLRAITRELGMASSAIHRYFPTKDDLLTALIIDAYDSLGEAVETADAAAHGFTRRWMAVCHAVRGWALEHRHEYELLYGTPVPGYRAPQETVTSAVRDTVVFGRIVSESYATGALEPPKLLPRVPEEFGDDAARVRQLIHGVPDDVIAVAMSAWTGLYGWVNFEMFGQFDNTIEAREVAFDHHAKTLAALLGLPAPPG
ncbi:MAG TPA: TetR/AcrR family transcriptional regulator [Stackebrandtia sp.]|jgi:AcrR family transcriptional regulator|uniref:TetR/AcrR family transcriptional regulator n=1 Tax=Stackebrandtia sp. TaxID=2023065 RepID=UPI002D49B49A|nr:TetR/AcrR family transcriptional regulator [Stackebrandtia sp.]HZE38167.1 TetR/AcrR family transcriptional regulator [Stackebrandtia sp.]